MLLLCYNTSLSLQTLLVPTWKPTKEICMERMVPKQ